MGVWLDEGDWEDEVEAEASEDAAMVAKGAVRYAMEREGRWAAGMLKERCAVREAVSGLRNALDVTERI